MFYRLGGIRNELCLGGRRRFFGKLRKEWWRLSVLRRLSELVSVSGATISA